MQAVDVLRYQVLELAGALQREKRLVRDRRPSVLKSDGCLRKSLAAPLLGPNAVGPSEVCAYGYTRGIKTGSGAPLRVRSQLERSSHLVCRMQSRCLHR